MKKYLCVVNDYAFRGTYTKIVTAENKRMAKFIAYDKRWEELESIEEIQ